MADVLFRTAYLLLYAAAWLLVFASWLTLRVTWAVACWAWRTAPPVIARLRQARRPPSANRSLVTGALVR